MKTTTIKDVAKHAGVSITTASFALNNVTGRVSEALKQKVLASAEELDYIPNAAARNLRVRVSNTIAVVYDESYLDEKNASTMQFVSGVIKHANKMGKDTLVKLINTKTGLIQAGEEYKRLWASQKVEGLILLMSQINETLLETMTAQGINFVVIPPIKKLIGYNSVYIDNFSLMKKATEFIYKRDYLDIYYLTMKSQERSDREKGYEAAMLESGLNSKFLYYQNGLRGKDQIADLLKTPLQNRKGKIAIACWNDVDAIQVMEVLLAEGIKIPEEVGVMGFDDIPASAHTYPPLTTISQPFEQMAERSVELILDNYDQKKYDLQHLIEVSGYIVERKSI
ncbi:MAG: LacI family DNA-binding transcriptional regulator [Vallitaleaceae bacterium]|nr:LacI family DNA-binding transcriptional regulator [Vallitaleaceae bacterium]